MKNFKKIILLCLLFLFFWFLFIIKLPITYIADDSPETITCHNLLWIQHPPGYALNTLIGKIFSLLPVGNPMFKSNLMSMFFHILAAIILFLMVLELLKNTNDKLLINVIAAISMLFYLFSNSGFLQAISAKGSIYTLHSFLISLIFYLLLKLNYRNKYFYLLSFVLGLSITNHWQSAIVVLPAIILFLFLSKYNLNIKRWVISSLFFLLGTSTFTFLFIRSYNNQNMLWVIKSIKDFLWLIGREQYFSAEATRSISEIIKFFYYLFFNILPKQYPYYLFLLLIPGIILLFKYNKSYCFVFITVVLTMCFAIASKNILVANFEWDVKPYLTFIYLFISVFISFNFYYFFKNIKNKSIKIAIFFPIFVILIVLLYNNCPNYSKYFLAYDYTKNILKTLPENSVFFAEGDLNVMGNIYANNVEKNKNILIISALLDHKWYRDYLKNNNPDIKIDNYFINHNECIKKIILLNSDKKFFYSNAFTKEWVSGLNLYHQGIINEITIYEDNYYYEKINPYIYFSFYSFRGAFDKVKYDDATKVFVLEAYGKSLVKMAKIFEQKNDEIKGYFLYIKAFNFYKNDVLAVNIAKYYLKNFQNEKAKYYLNQALKINKNNQYARNILRQI